MIIRDGHGLDLRVFESICDLLCMLRISNFLIWFFFFVNLLMIIIETPAKRLGEIKSIKQKATTPIGALTHAGEQNKMHKLHRR